MTYETITHRGREVVVEQWAASPSWFYDKDGRPLEEPVLVEDYTFDGHYALTTEEHIVEAELAALRAPTGASSLDATTRAVVSVKLPDPARTKSAQKYLEQQAAFLKFGWTQVDARTMQQSFCGGQVIPNKRATTKLELAGFPTITLFLHATQDLPLPNREEAARSPDGGVPEVPDLPECEVS